MHYQLLNTAHRLMKSVRKTTIEGARSRIQSRIGDDERRKHSRLPIAALSS